MARSRQTRRLWLEYIVVVASCIADYVTGVAINRWETFLYQHDCVSSKVNEYISSSMSISLKCQKVAVQTLANNHRSLTVVTFLNLDVIICMYL